MKAEDNGHAHQSERHCDSSAEPAGGALGANADGYSPLTCEIPEAVAEMERRGGDSYEIKGDEPGIHHGGLNVGVCGHAAADEALGVQVPGDEDESDDAGPTLERVHPVGHPGMAEDVRLPFPPDIHAVEAMEQKRQPEHRGFDKNAPGNQLKFAGNRVVALGAYQGVAVGPEMFGEECSNWNYAAK